MKKKMLSIILTVVTSVTSFAPNYCYADNVFDVDKNSEYGYIFTLKNNSVNLNDASTNDNINIISEPSKIYHADSIEDIKQITNSSNIGLIAEDIPIELFDYPEDANDAVYSQEWSHTACSINEYWKNDIKGEGVTIGIIDTGINREHEDFEGVSIATGLNICAAIDKNESEYYNTNDYNGHGTEVASIIGARINNSLGMAGIVDDCTIVPLRVYDTSSTYSLSVGALLTALQYAQNIGCDVVNLSLGFKNPSDALLEITDTLINELEESGMLIIAAVGNDGTSTNAKQYPASCENAIGVGAISLKSDSTYSKSSFSTANESVFVSAPGDDIWTAGIASNDYYTTKDGTSFACPIVAAAAVGAKQLNPEIKCDDFKEILKNTSKDVDNEGYDINTGYGMIDFKGIVEYMSVKTPNPTEVPTIAPTTLPTLLPTPSLTPTLVPEASITPTPEVTIEPTPTITSTYEPTNTPTTEPTQMPIVTITPTLQPTIIPTCTPKPVSTPNITPSPVSTVQPTPAITPTAKPEVSLEPIETSKPNTTMSPTISPIPEYVLETHIEKNEKGVIQCIAKNNTNLKIDAIGIIAIYDGSGILKGLRLVDGFQVGFTITEIEIESNKDFIIKYYIWTNIHDMKPYPNTSCSEFNL